MNPTAWSYNITLQIYNRKSLLWRKMLLVIIPRIHKSSHLNFVQWHVTFAGSQ